MFKTEKEYIQEASEKSGVSEGKITGIVDSAKEAGSAAMDLMKSIFSSKSADDISYDEIVEGYSEIDFDQMVDDVFYELDDGRVIKGINGKFYDVTDTLKESEDDEDYRAYDEIQMYIED